MVVGHSDDVDPADAVAIAIGQCREQLAGRTPQAGLLVAAFSTFGLELAARVREAFPGVALMGATSSAEMSSTSGFLEDSVTLVLFASDDIEITVGFGPGLEAGIDDACRAAIAEATSTTTLPAKVCVVFADGFVVEPQRILDALRRALPDDVVVVGGGSARPGLGSGTPSWQFCGDRVATNAVVVLLFSGPVKHAISIGMGWRALGATGTVTRSSPGRLDQIDDRPALEFLSRYLDTTGPASYGNPLAVREPGTGQSYLRAVVGSDPQAGSLNLFGSIPEGAIVQLTTATTDEILGGTRNALDGASAEYPVGSQPEAALMFSCAVRRLLLGSRANSEVELAKERFGPSVPLAGLYCYGEIGPVQGSETSRFFNDTFVTLLLGS